MLFRSYGAGDVCVKNLRQVVTAVSDGAVAATSLEKYVEQLHEELEIPELRGEEEEKERPHIEEAAEESGSEGEGNFISNEIRGQLKGLFTKFANPVKIKAVVDNSKLGKEIEGFVKELMELEGPLSWEKVEANGEELAPYMELVSHKGEATGICFHGVPGGHEFNSFIVALYNVAGPGQEVDPSIKEQIMGLKKKTDIKVLVSLSCTMCPETVMSAQRTAALSENIEAHMLDLAHFPQLKEKYKVMSVPCIVVNDEKIYFGKKNLEEMTKILSENR